MRGATRWVKAAVSAACFYWLYWLVRHEGHKFADVLHRTDPHFLVLSFLIIPFMVGTSCAKWKVLLDLQGRNLGFWSLFRIYLIGYYFTNIMPTNIGGDVVRLFYTGKRVGSHGHVLASIFFERFTGILCQLGLVAFGPLVRPSLYLSPYVWIPAAGALALLGAFTLMLFHHNPFAWIFRLLGRIMPVERIPLAARIMRKADGFQEKLTFGLNELRGSPETILKVVGLTVLFYVLCIVNVWLGYRTFGEPVGYPAIIAVLATAMLMTAVPISLNGLGLTELSYAKYFSLCGVPAAATAAMALFLRLKSILLGVVGYISYITYKGERFTQATAREMKE